MHRALFTISAICCGLVFVSFALFARDQMAGASKHQQTVLSDTVGVGVAPRHPKVAQPRRFIDGAAGALTSPFATLVRSDNEWLKHGVGAALALLIYGFGLRFVAGFVPGPMRR